MEDAPKIGDDPQVLEAAVNGLQAVLGVGRDVANRLLDKYAVPLAQYTALARQGDKVAAGNVQDLIAQVSIDLAEEGLELQAAAEQQLTGYLVTLIQFAKVLLV